MPIHKHYILPGVVLIIALIGTACGSVSEVNTTAEPTETEIIATTTIAIPSSTATSTTTVTPQPSVTMLTPTVTTTTSSPTSTLPPTTGTTSQPGEMETYVLDQALLVNLISRSTPIGTLCWATWEQMRMHVINAFEIMADQEPKFQIIYPADYDHHYTLIDALQEITKPEIVSIADSPQFSKELQLFAKAFFEEVRTEISQIDELTSNKLDYAEYPIPELEDIPYVEAFFDQLESPCGSPKPAID